jgi:hypothetical protein
MAADKKTTQHVANSRPYLQGVAKYLVEGIYGPDGPPLGTRFTELEDLAVALGEVFTKNFMDLSLSRQAGKFEKMEKKPDECPGCGRPARPEPPEPRVVVSRAGEAEWQEPSGYCEHCRRAFFPSVAESGD